MNLLNLTTLEQKLYNNSISDKNGFIYLITNWVIFGFTSFAFVTAQYGNPGVMVLLTILPIIGVIPSFIANQKGDGQDFLKRLVVMHLAIGIRYFGFTIFLAIAGNLVESVLQNHAQIEFILSLMALPIIVGFYFHLAKSLGRISKMTK